MKNEKALRGKGEASMCANSQVEVLLMIPQIRRFLILPRLCEVPQMLILKLNREKQTRRPFHLFPHHISPLDFIASSLLETH